MSHLAALGLLCTLGACGGGGGGAAATTSGTSTTTTTTTTNDGSAATGTTSGTGSSTGTLSGGTGTVTSAPASGSTSSSGTGFNRIETPVPWDYTVSQPSRSACAAGEGKTYEVGTGKAYATPKDVPWLSLVACDQVLINYRVQPYTDILFIGVRGEKNKYITIKGVPGPNGERPIFDGNGAVTPVNTGFNSNYDGQGMIVVGRPVSGVGGVADGKAAYGYKPGYLHISGLSIRNVVPPAKFTALAGTLQTWNGFTSGIYVNPAENLAITNCELANNGLGLFINSLFDEAQQTRNVLVSNNYFHDNGISGHAELHNAYTESVGIIYEYNYFGPPIAGTAGDNIKERSAGVIFRYNYIEGGVHSIALRDPQSNEAWEAAQVDTLGVPLISQAFVYGNIFVMRGQDQDNGIMVGHGDGAFGTGNQAKYGRYGNLHFYANRVVAQYDYRQYTRDAVVLFELLDDRPTTVHARNNLFYTQTLTSGATVAPFALFYWQGLADFAGNWFNAFTNTLPGVTGGDGGLAVGTAFNGTGLNGMTTQTGNPGFVNLAGGNYNVTAGSPFTTLNAALPADVVARNLLPTGQAVQAPFTGPASP